VPAACLRITEYKKSGAETTMTQRPRVSRSLFLILLAVLATLTLSYFPFSKIRAANTATVLPSAGKPLVNLKNPQTPKITYTGASDAVAALQDGRANPTALGEGDFNADGAMDVVAGYSTKDGGVIALFLGNPDAYAPTDPTLYGKAMKGNVPPTFLSKAKAFRVPEYPDLVATGDFNRDGYEDVLVAARGGSLYLLAGDGHGNLLAPRIVPLTGQVTAMAVTGNSHVVVSLDGPSGSQLVILAPSPEGLTAGASYPLPARGDSVAWGNLGGGADVAVGAGANVVLIYNALEANAQTETVSLPFNVQALVLGDFIWDQENRTEISVLADDGSIHILQHGTLITAPLTAVQIPGRRATALAKSKQPSNPTALGAWSVAKELPYAGSATAGPVSSSAFNSPRVASSSTHDLMVLDSVRSQLHILDTSGKTGSPSADISFSGTPVAALAMPQKINSDRDIVVLTSSQAAPMLVTSRVSITLNVNTTADIDSINACTTSTTTIPSTLSLREAVCLANNSAPDTATINVPAGTYDLTSLETGELQVGTGNSYSLSIIGSSPSNTIIQQTDGHDRIIEQDPSFSGNVNITIENVTAQGGDCTTGIDCTYGGAFLLGGGPSGSPDNVTLTNVVVSNNTAGYSGDGENGGAMDLTSSGTFTFTNSTFSNNTAVYEGAPDEGGGPGGAVYVEENAGGGNVTITNCSFTNNTSQWGGGGALYSWLQGSGNTTTISGSTFTGNEALDDASDGGAQGGAIHSDGDMTISNSRISGNTSADGSTLGTGLWTDDDSPFNVVATNNWWGCNGGPGASGCDTVATSGNVTVSTNPWLVLSISAGSTQIDENATTGLTADLNTNSNGGTGFSVPNGTPISFGATLGTISAASTTLTSGVATATFNAGGSAGAGSGTATVDNATVSTTIDILDSVIVTTSPGSLSITVDGTTYTAPQSFNWVVGSPHTISTTSPQNVSGGSEEVFGSWSDGGAQAHSVTAPAATTAYTASFNEQYQLTTAANPTADGSVTPTSGNYYTSGTVVPLTATANTGYSFTNWTGNVTNSTSASTSITMTAPQSVTANFSLIIVAAQTTTSVSSNNNPSFTAAPGNSVTFTATVTSNTTVNEGTFTFSDTANDFTCSGGNTVAVSNGQASCTTSFSTEGSRNVTANYNGTVNFQTSNGFITQTVNNHTVVTGNQFCNQGAITIPSTAGAATPYPSNIFVTGVGGNISAVTVRLNNIGSSDIAQTDLLLVGPTGAKIIPFASVGDGSTINGVNITLDDAASNLIPGGSPLTSGSYKPTSITGSTSLIFPAPAPLVNASNYAATDGSATLLSTFSGTAPNGTWALYAMDNAGNGAATIAGGWCVNITASSAPAITSANSTSFTFNTPNTFTVTATGNPTPTFSENGALPNGVTLSTSGVLSGTPTQPGSFPVTITASNGISPNATQSFTLNVSQASTSIAITNVNPASEAYGQDASVTITAVLSWTGTGSSPTAGDVTISGNGPSSYGTTSCGAPSGNTLTCTATYTPTAADTVGSYTESASFSGDSNYTGSSSTQSNNFSITQATSSTSVGSSQNPSTLGQQVTFTATIDGEYGLVVRRNGEVISGTPVSKRSLNQRKSSSVPAVPASGITGTVTWSSNTGCSATPVSGNPGTSQCVTSTLPQGTDTITATYSGDTNHSGSTETLSGGQQVNAAGTMTSLMSSKNPSDTGQVVSFTATVTSSGPAPTGTVKFLNGSKVLGTRTLSSGVATYSTGALPAGTDVITATYEGSSTDSGSSSSPLNQVVLETTKTTIASSANPAVVDQSITATATVSSSNGPPPDGETVTFHWGSTVLGTGTLSGGKASITFSKTLPDTYSLTASYGGDSNFAPSSATLMEVVDKATTTTTLMSSANPSNYGEGVTFTITVAPEYSGTTPQGSVELKKGGVVIWEGTLTNGTAQVTISNLAVGNHTLAATYTGGERFLSSTSAQLVQTVK
jgi:Big-like domain-containing protein/List-Bact-rpt repeat protein